MTESPYIEISIKSTSDLEKTRKKFLSPIAKRNEASPFNTVSWKGPKEDPILRLDYGSYAKFEESYKTGELLLKLLNLLEDGIFNLEEVKKKFLFAEGQETEWKSVSYEEMYLILKYTTNYKSPLRKNYRLSEYFIELFRDHIVYEEIHDGFLIFFHRESDFKNSNLSKSNPAEVKEWLKAKKVNLSSEIMSNIMKMM
ncbi:MAG: hypothetical protein ACTSRK_14825 [Promethearchaeota archaeon]